MKTYLLKYLKPNTHTFYDIIKHQDHVAAEEAVAKEVDPDKKKLIVTPEQAKRFIDLADDIVIMPGINEISEENYLLLKAHPNFDGNFNCRPPLMEWVPGFGPDDEKMKTFSTLKDQEALNVVEAMWNKSLLEKYLKVEKRERIKQALEEQIEKLTVKAKKVA